MNQNKKDLLVLRIAPGAIHHFRGPELVENVLRNRRPHFPGLAINNTIRNNVPAVPNAANIRPLVLKAHLPSACSSRLRLPPARLR